MAFPTTGVIDDFNRASIGTNWSGCWGDGLFSISSNHVRASGWAGGYYNASSYGANSECYFTWLTVDGNKDVTVFMKMDTPASPNGYGIHITGASTFAIGGIVGGSFSVEATYTQAVSSGDSVGLWNNGNSIYAMYKASGGSWTTVGTITNTGHPSGGYVGCDGFGNTYNEYDDWGGGTVTTATGPTAKQSNPRFGALVRANYW